MKSEGIGGVGGTKVLWVHPQMRIWSVCAVLDGWSLKTCFGLAEPLGGCLSSPCPLSLSSLTGFRPTLLLVLQPLPCPLHPPSLPFSSLPLVLCFLLITLWNTSLSDSLPEALCLLELQVKLEGIISYNQQNLVHGTPPPPRLFCPSAIQPPPSHNPHHGQGQRNTSRLGEKPHFVLGSLLSSDRGESTNRHKGKEALMSVLVRCVWVCVLRWSEWRLESNAWRKVEGN